MQGPQKVPVLASLVTCLHHRTLHHLPSLLCKGSLMGPRDMSKSRDDLHGQHTCHSLPLVHIPNSPCPSITEHRASGVQSLWESRRTHSDTTPWPPSPVSLPAKYAGAIDRGRRGRGQSSLWPFLCLSRDSSFTFLFTLTGAM